MPATAGPHGLKTGGYGVDRTFCRSSLLASGVTPEGRDAGLREPSGTWRTARSFDV